MNIAIITGASSGLGREFVLQLDQSESGGFDEMWIIARRRNRLEELRSLTRTPLRIFSLDLIQPDSFREISDMLKQIRPVIRILVNAAGFGKIGSIRDITLEDACHMIDLNCRAAVCMTEIVLPYMERKSRILEICSTASFQPFPYLNVYAATKAFLYRYSRALRVELMGRGIRVTAVCPYWIKDTEFIHTAQKTKDSRYIRHFPLASKKKNVVRMALTDSRLGLPVSTPGIVCLIHRIVAKFIPHELMMLLWSLLRRL